jgi:hypothetical protein
MGLAFAGTELLNPRTSAAEAYRMNMETTHQQAVYQLQEQLSTAKTKAEIREIERQQGLLEAQYQHDIQALSQDLAHQDLAFRTWMTVLTLIASVLAITLFISTIIWVSSQALVHVRSTPPKEEPITKSIPPVEKRIPALAEREPYDPLDPKEILYANRLNERLQEITAIREDPDEAELLAARLRALMNTTSISSEKYGKRPLAG